MSTVKDRVVALVEVGGSLYEGGNYSYRLVYPKGQDDTSAQVAVVILEHSIAYHKAGVSNYMGISFFNGETLVEVKPVEMWRNGENSANDRPENHWRVENFVAKGDGYELAVCNGRDVVEIWSLNGTEIIQLEQLNKLTYMERVEDKTPQDRHAIVLEKVRKGAETPNHEITDIFCLDLLDQTIRKGLARPWDSGYNEFVQVYAESDRFLLLFKTHGHYYSEETFCGFFAASPASLNVLGLVTRDSGVREGESYHSTLSQIVSYERVHGRDSLSQWALKELASEDGYLIVRDCEGREVMKINIVQLARNLQ